MWRCARPSSPSRSPARPSPNRSASRPSNNSPSPNPATPHARVRNWIARARISPRPSGCARRPSSARPSSNSNSAKQPSAQLEKERQARIQAEQRATEAQAEARAQAQVANELRNIRQVQVKEESRGLVLTLSGSVLFRSGSSDLLAAAKRRLNDVAEALNKTQNPLLIEGHTDSQGSTELNEELSYLRAEAVRDYLVDRGVDSERTRIDGRGKDQPIASNTTAEGRANNRRVEIVIERGVGGGGQQQQQQQPPTK